MHNVAYTVNLINRILLKFYSIHEGYLNFEYVLH